MHSKRFQEVLEETIERVNKVLGSKADEYATNDDRLSNFRTAAALDGVTMAQALQGMKTKHTVSIAHMVHSEKNYPLEQWDEKIIDEINYLILLRAVLRDGGTEISAPKIRITYDFIQKIGMAQLTCKECGELSPVLPDDGLSDRLFNNWKDDHEMRRH